MELRQQALDVVSGALDAMQRGLAGLRRTELSAPAPDTIYLGTSGSGRAGAGRPRSAPPVWDDIRRALRERAWLPEYSARLPDDPED